MKEEIQELNDSIIWWQNRFNALNRDNEQLQQRIDKAIEYIEFNDENLYTSEPDYNYEEELVDNYELSNYREDLLEILKG